MPRTRMKNKIPDEDKEDFWKIMRQTAMLQSIYQMIPTLK